jgi:hypothetical protein
MTFTSPVLIAAGRLVGVAVACGFNLYATVAFLGVASRLEWFTLPAGLRGLENTVVIASATVLYLAESIIDKFPYVDAVWEAVHTLVRPAAAGMLTAVAFAGHPQVQLVAIAGAVALVTLSAHGAKAGLRIAVQTPRRPWLRIGISFLEDALALGIAAAALLNPVAAVAVAGIAMVVLLLAGPGLWRAGWLGVRAFLARLRGFFGERRWRSRDEIDAPVRSLVEHDPHGVHPARATRAALYGVPGVGAFRNGWLVLEHGVPVFIFRALFSSRRLELPRSSGGRVRHGLMLDVLELETPPARYALFLLKDGPAPQVVLAEMLG